MTHQTHPQSRLLRLAIVLLVASSPGLGCGEDDAGAGVVVPDDARSQLRWRRFRPLLADYGRALELEPEELCRDADGGPCALVGPVSVTDYLRAHQGVEQEHVEARCAELQGVAECGDLPYIEEFSPHGVHVFALGGNEPFIGTFAPLAAPGLTTPLVVDRVALLACGERVARDAQGGPVVFTALDLSLSVVTVTTPGLRETVADLYRRLLARDASKEEPDTVLEIVGGEPSLSAAKAARLACFTIATTTEVLFQ